MGKNLAKLRKQGNPELPLSKGRWLQQLNPVLDCGVTSFEHTRLHSAERKPWLRDPPLQELFGKSGKKSRENAKTSQPRAKSISTAGIDSGMIVFWGSASKMGPHQLILNSADVFSSAIETSVTPCQPLREERESGAPPLRETTFQREPTESYRCIKGADYISLIQLGVRASPTMRPKRTR
jgi:hypothetical protein